VLSHQRARAALREGSSAMRSFPCHQGPQSDIVFNTDERPMDTSMEKMGKLRPASRRTEVSPPATLGINDGAPRSS